MIKAIAFDLGGVVFAEGKTAAYKKLQEEFGYDPKVVKAVLTSEKSKELRKGLLADDDFLAWAQEQLPEGYDAQTIKQYWYDGYTPDDDIFDLLRDLKGKCRLMIFSGNIKSRIEHLDSKYHFRQLFDAEVYSYKHHTDKPDPAFVETMIKTAGVAPEEIAYIDDIESSAEAAKTLGVNAITYKSGEIKELRKTLKNLGIEVEAEQKLKNGDKSSP